MAMVWRRRGFVVFFQVAFGTMVSADMPRMSVFLGLGQQRLRSVIQVTRITHHTTCSMLLSVQSPEGRVVRAFAVVQVALSRPSSESLCNCR